MQQKWWTLLVVCTGIFMLLLDITVVNVALPDIEKDLGASFTDLQWVVDAYALTLAAFLLVSGSVADLLGRRLVFVVGIAVFTLASLGCALSGDPTVLNVMRAVQGVGGAMMFATSLALIAQAFHGPERGTAFGAFGATTGAAVAVGPLVGGALTDGFGWEAIFIVNLPIGIAAIVVTLARVHESRDPRAGGVDLPGLVTFSAALFCLVFGLVRGNGEGWSSTPIVSVLTAAVVLLAAFVVIELRRKDPMLDLSLFRKPAFAGASIAAFALSASMFAMFLYITLYMQNILGYEPLEAGLRFLPITLLSFFAGPIAGKLSTRFPVRIFLGAGLGLVGLGLLLMNGVSASSDWTTLLAGFLVAGVGIGLVNPPLASAAVGVVQPARSGMASGINSTFRQVGIATGIAALGAIFQSRVEDDVVSSLSGSAAASQAHEIGHAVASGGAQGVIGSVPPEAREMVAAAARDAFISGLNTLFVIAAITALVGAVLSAALVRQRDFVTTAAPEAAPAA